MEKWKDNIHTRFPHDCFGVRKMIALGDTEVPVSVLILPNAVGWVGCADAKHTRRPAAVMPFLPEFAATTNVHFHK
jgi:hypothetical protein